MGICTRSVTSRRQAKVWTIKDSLAWICIDRAHRVMQLIWSDIAKCTSFHFIYYIFMYYNFFTIFTKMLSTQTKWFTMNYLQLLTIGRINAVINLLQVGTTDQLIRINLILSTIFTMGRLMCMSGHSRWHVSLYCVQQNTKSRRLASLTKMWVVWNINKQHAKRGASCRPGWAIIVP